MFSVIFLAVEERAWAIFWADCGFSVIMRMESLEVTSFMLFDLGVLFAFAFGFSSGDSNSFDGLLPGDSIVVISEGEGFGFTCFSTTRFAPSIGMNDDTGILYCLMGSLCFL